MKVLVGPREHDTVAAAVAASDVAARAESDAIKLESQASVALAVDWPVHFCERVLHRAAADVAGCTRHTLNVRA